MNDADDAELNRLRRNIVLAQVEANARREEREAQGNLDRLMARTPELVIASSNGASAQDWKTVDLGPYVRGEVKREPPTQLLRSDGVALLYDSKLTWISGEPESGKSWIAILAYAERLIAGDDALYVDFETDPLDIVGRLLALGVPAEAIEAHLRYIRPYTPMNPEGCSFVLGASVGARIATLDGVNAAMGNSGYDPNNAKDFYKWWEPLGLQLQRSCRGPLLCIDHVVKDATARGAYASGTGQKLAAVDVHLGVEKIKPFGLGLTGKSRIVIHKDKPAALRQHAEGAAIAELTMTSDPLTHELTATLAPPSSSVGEDGGFRPTFLMEKVSRMVEESDEPLSQNAIVAGVPHKRVGVIAAIHRLVKEGFLETVSGGRGATLHTSKSPFRDDESSLVPTDSRPVPGTGDRDWFPVPPPIQGNRSEPVDGPLNGGNNKTTGSRPQACPRCGRETRGLDRCPAGHPITEINA